MLATKSESVREYTTNIGRERPLAQWILSDFDSWEPNPFYVGPDQGHPEYDDAPTCSVYATFKEASEAAKKHAMYSGNFSTVEHYKNRCWVVWY